jgi:hypothetical protein
LPRRQRECTERIKTAFELLESVSEFGEIMDANDAKRLVRGLIDEEVSAGFPFVRRVPSVMVWKTLVHVETLSPEERDVLFDILAERGCAWLQTDLDMERYVERQKELVRHPAYQHFCAARTQPWPWKYADPSFLRQMLDGWRQVKGSAAGPPFDFSPVPLAVVESAEPPIVVKAPEIRKEVKRVLAERFQATPTNTGAGIWNYPGECQGRPFTLAVDYGVRAAQLRYGVAPGRFSPNQRVAGGTWEDMLGLGSYGQWDFVCQHNLAQSVVLIAEVVEKMLSLQARAKDALP